MVQFNLLPDVKLQFIKARRTKRMMVLISIVVVAVSLFVFLLMITTVDIVQKKSLSDLNKDIQTYSNQLKATPDLDKILTVQNQIGTLDTLHSQKPVSSRLFNYIAETTPAQAGLSNFTIDYTKNTLSVTGTAPSLDVINTYTDTLKSTTYTTTTNQTATPAFSAVVLSSFGRSSKNATFTITASFDPAIFQDTNTVTFKVPSEATVDPANVFSTGGSH